MKLLLVLSMVTLGMFKGCKGSGDSQAFLPGIYVCQTENEFCRIVDTLIVRKKGLGDTEYHVTRRSSFQRIRQGMPLAREYQEDEWEAGYDATNAVLLSPGKTREVQYVKDENKMVKGEFSYQKVE